MSKKLESTGQLYVATSGDEKHVYIEVDMESARHWVINHCDSSKEWLVELAKPMRILISGTATRDMIRKKPVHAGRTQYEMDFHKMMSAVQGQWLEVETEFCFPDQFNTTKIEGVSENGMRIGAASVANIDFGILGEAGWKEKARNYQLEGWNNKDVRFLLVDSILYKTGHHEYNPYRVLEWDRGYNSIGETIKKDEVTKDGYCKDER